MSSEYMTPQRGRVGRWLPRDPGHVDAWLRRLKKSLQDRPRELIEPIRELERMVDSDPALQSNISMMFAEARQLRKLTPLGEPEVRTFHEFLHLLNGVMTSAPECYQTTSGGELQPAGMIGFPINAILDWPMATLSGYDVFSNALFNQQLKKILGAWSRFLVKPESRFVLTQPEQKLDPTITIIGWLSPQAQSEMVSVATSAVGEGKTYQGTFPQIFRCQPGEADYGFRSWDDFFVRTWASGEVRPVSSPDDPGVVVNACESAPFALHRNVKISDEFWLKGQPYSLENMLNWDEDTPRFAGGTVYQAFLSALSYHRWHSPVSGTIKKTSVVNGTYYLENAHKGFGARQPDAAAPNNSQAFLSAVATRALIFIEADNPAIGLMCVIPIGMAEVSSCEITVKPGQHVNKGDPLGMFHFGGSTHCLVFRPEVKLDFELYGQKPGPSAETNIRINTAIARVK